MGDEKVVTGCSPLGVEVPLNGVGFLTALHGHVGWKSRTRTRVRGAEVALREIVHFISDNSTKENITMVVIQTLGGYTTYSADNVQRA